MPHKIVQLSKEASVWRRRCALKIRKNQRNNEIVVTHDIKNSYIPENDNNFYPVKSSKIRTTSYNKKFTFIKDITR